MKYTPLSSVLRKIAAAGKTLPELVFTVGIPGSGKSTWIQSQKGYEVVSPDLVRSKMDDITDQSKNAEVWAVVKDKVKKALEKGSNVILDATNVDSIRRKQFLQELPDHVLKAKIFDVDPEEAKRRIKEDISVGMKRSNVPDYAIDRMYQLYRDTIDKGQLESEGFEIL